MPPARYVKPSFFDRLFNGLAHGLARLGVSMLGARVLAVRGRRSGEWRSVPVNLLELQGVRYLVAPRGDTQWVRNLRAAGEGELRLGARRQPFRATEILVDAEKLPILRAYLRKWRFEVGRFFPTAAAGAADEALLRVASDYPVFRIEDV